MQIICISRGTYSGGQELARSLAEKLGYGCLSREELIEAATREGIHVGKLEMAVVKSGIFSEHLALERDLYLAFSTAYLCEKSMEGGLVYHGRTGHLLVSGVSHVLRVRVLADEEYRIHAAMQKLGIDREKAHKYIDEVDEDRRRWVHSLYGVSWEDAAKYDVVINLAQMSLENAAAALMNMAQLPDFQMTPASTRAIENLSLAARVRLAIAQDERTHAASVKVSAENGLVTVTYLPQDTKIADFIPAVCKDLSGLKEIRATMAMTNLLWIEEEFHPGSEVWEQVVEIATKWNAAVEIIRLAPEKEEIAEEDQTIAAPLRGEGAQVSRAYNGGIEDDVPDAVTDNGNFKRTRDELAMVGKSGGGRAVYGGEAQLINAIDRTIPYTLVVIGEVFKSKGHSARLRATRDLRSFLSDRIKAPVVTSDELGSQYLFGKRDIPKVLAFLIVVLVIYLLVFTNQEFVLAFLANAGWYAEGVKDTFLSRVGWAPRIIISLAVFIMVPTIAYCYGTIAKAIMKLIKME